MIIITTLIIILRLITEPTERDFRSHGEFSPRFAPELDPFCPREYLRATQLRAYDDRAKALL